MAQNITLMGASYSDVPSVELPKTGGGTAEFFDARSVTYSLSGGATVSANPSNAIAGQGFSVKLKAPAGYTLFNVSVTMGGVDITSTAFTPDESGGGTPTETQHEIYFEFSDSTNTTITGYWDDDFISDAITATTPTTYDSKTVTLAQLDGTTWYEPAPIPLNTELIDYTKCLSNTMINNQGQEEQTQWYYATDYTPVDHSMTFTYKASLWHYICFYDSSKTFISYIYVYNDATTDPNYGNTGDGTLTPAKIPSDAAYIRTTGAAASSEVLSLIRTA